MKDPNGIKQIMDSKNIIFRVLMFYTLDGTEEYKPNSLIVFHALCNIDGFREVLFDQHQFKSANFDSFVKKSKERFNQQLQNEEWDLLTNQCASIKAFCNAMPERQTDYSDLIVPVIKLISERTGTIRKNAATLLAKLSENPDNKKIMVANHGTEVLVSLKN